MEELVMNKCLKRTAPFLLGFILMVTGCATNKVAIELVDYINQGILGIADLERISLEHYAAVTGKNYTTDQRVYEALKENVIPTYKRFLEELRNIPLKQEEIIRLHKIYLYGASMLYDGFKLKMIGLEQKDESIIILANQKIEKGRIETERWRQELMPFAKKHGAEEERKKEKAEDIGQRTDDR